MALRFKLKAKNSSGEQTLYIDPKTPEWDENLVGITLAGKYEGEEIQIDFDEVTKGQLKDMARMMISELEGDRKDLEIVTEEELDKVWGNADFGAISRRDVIRYACLKVACGWYQGHTSKTIIEELELKKKDKNELTDKGMNYLWVAFNGEGTV